MASAVEAEEWAVANTCLFVFLLSFALGGMLLKVVCAAALHTAVLAWLYLAGLRARLVAQEVAASTDDQGGAVHKFYRSYLSSKHGYWPCQDALGDGAVGIRKSEGDCTVATLDAVYADEPLGALGKGFLGQ